LKSQKEKVGILEEELNTLRDSRNHKVLLLTKSQHELPLQTRIKTWGEYSKRKNTEVIDRNELKILIRRGIPVELRNEVILIFLFSYTFDLHFSILITFVKYLVMAIPHKSS